MIIVRRWTSSLFSKASGIDEPYGSPNIRKFYSAMKFNKRRKFHRINFEGKANVQFLDDKFECLEVQNLSLGGMFVKGQIHHPQSNECIIKLFHKETTGNNSLQALAKVVWSSDDGSGLKFVSMTFENYMLLVTTLINNAKQPSIILHQFPKKTPFEISDKLLEE